MRYKRRYNETNTCDRCRERDKVRKLESGKTYKECDERNNWTGRWLCNICWGEDYRKSPNSINSMMKSVANFRTGNQDPNSNTTKGDFFQRLTYEWLRVHDLNIENDNYNTPIDHSAHQTLGILQTKGRLYSVRYG